MELTPDTAESIKNNRNRSSTPEKLNYDIDRIGQDIDYLKVKIDLALNKKHDTPNNFKKYECEWNADEHQFSDKRYVEKGSYEANNPDLREYNHTYKSSYEQKNLSRHYDKTNKTPIGILRNKTKPSLENEVKGYSYIKKSYPAKPLRRYINSEIKRRPPEIGRKAYSRQILFGSEEPNTMSSNGLQKTNNEVEYGVKRLQSSRNKRGLHADIVTSYSLKNLRKVPSNIQNPLRSDKYSMEKIHPEFDNYDRNPNSLESFHTKNYQKLTVSGNTKNPESKKINQGKHTKDTYFKQLAFTSGFDNHCWK